MSVLNICFLVNVNAHFLLYTKFLDILDSFPLTGNQIVIGKKIKFIYVIDLVKLLVAFIDISYIYLFQDMFLEAQLLNN